MFTLENAKKNNHAQRTCMIINGKLFGIISLLLLHIPHQHSSSFSTEPLGCGHLANVQLPRGEEWYFSMMETKINLLKMKITDMYGISKVSIRATLKFEIFEIFR